jgi:hypothetical protein
MGFDKTTESMESPASDELPSVGDSFEDSLLCTPSSSSSESPLEGRSNISSSDTCSCRAGIGRKFRLRFEGNLLPRSRGLVGTQIRGTRPWSCLCCQWDSRRYISSICMWDGSFHSNSSGMHSALIQEDGSFANVFHGMVWFCFPVTKPNSYLLYLLAKNSRSYSRICARQ